MQLQFYGSFVSPPADCWCYAAPDHQPVLPGPAWCDGGFIQIRPSVSTALYLDPGPTELGFA